MSTIAASGITGTPRHGMSERHAPSDQGQELRLAGESAVTRGVSDVWHQGIEAGG